MQIGGRQVKSVSIEAVIIRADGTREPLGTIGYWHQSWFRRLAFKVQRAWKGGWHRVRRRHHGQPGAERSG